MTVGVERWNSVQEQLEELQDRLAVVEGQQAGGRSRAAEEALTDIEASEADVRGSGRPTAE